MRLRSLLMSVFVVALGIANDSQAALLSGTGGAPAAIPGGTVIDFDTAPTGLYAATTLSGVTFTGVGAPFDIGPDFNGSFNTFGGKSLFNGFDFIPSAFRIDFSGAVDAFAFNWGAADNTWTLTAYDSSNVVIESHSIAQAFGSNAGDYRGISAPGIAYITLVDNADRFSGDYVFIDAFTFHSDAGPASVPEPASLVVLLGLTGGLAVARRRRIG